MILREPLEIETGSLGAAFDIGTTTVACAIASLEDGAILGTGSVPNPQARWGRDVVSRMEAALSTPSALDEMSKALTSACDSLIEKIAGPERSRVRRAVIAGNSVMEHLFFGLSIESLARVPYKPAFRQARTVPAKEAGIKIDGSLYAFPLIGGFVGGDAVAVALSLGLKEETRPVLSIDIGTNSEIMLAANGNLYAASAAAGPAFEGGEISCGMVAGPGAISGASVNGDSIRLDVIGDIAPKGICGSGLVSAVSALIDSGIIERTGRIKDPDEVSTNLASKIRQGAQGNEFVLFRGPKAEVVLNQQDIRSLQTAKSATRAGISMLLAKAGLRPEDIVQVYIAGAFGSSLDASALRNIGLFDPAWKNIKAVGDAALDGAISALNESMRNEAEDIASNAKYVSLSGSAHFEREFIKSMNF